MQSVWAIKHSSEPSAVIKAFYIHFEHAVEILLAVASSLPMWEMPAYFTRVDSATLGQQLKRGSCKAT